MTEGVFGFHGEYEFLSNFYPAPITLDNISAPTTEHFYQACKTTNAEDFHKVILAPTPGAAKTLANSLEIIPDWDSIKDLVMHRVLTAKFTQNEDLKQLLLDTGNDYLEETNDWGDTYWGISNGHGLNRLGEILMQIRGELNQ